MLLIPEVRLGSWLVWDIRVFLFAMLLLHFGVFLRKRTLLGQGLLAPLKLKVCSYQLETLISDMPSSDVCGL